MPLLLRKAQTGTGRDFAGQQTTREFIAPAPDSDGPGELQRYRLKLAPDGTLTLYQISTLTTAIDARQRGVQGWLATPLLSGVTDLDLRYYGPREDTGASGWQPDWLHRLTLPVLVRVHVAMADASARAWPDLTIRVRAATIDSCERDFKTDQCKGTT